MGLIKGLVGLVKSIGEMLVGFETVSMLEGRARYVTASDNENKNSWIRLANPSFKKLGGGQRVKKITINDNWDNMISGQNDATYGKQYEYTTGSNIGGQQNVVISSGVAAYEPVFGGDENLCRSPLNYSENNLLAPGNSYYTETPFGEALFPAPTVGYSEVKVTNLPIGANGTGWTVHKFFTAKDFPVIADYTAPKSERNPPGRLNKFFKMKVRDYLTMSQGFVVEVNDMHGKMKEESVFDNNGSPISSTLYHYKTDDDNAVRKHLKNTVKVIKPDGSIPTAEATMGVEVDFWQDLREEETYSKGVGAAFNAEGFSVWLIPYLILPFIKTMLQTDESRFRSVVTTKFIKRQGILDKITHIKDGAVVTTENLYYDSETGQVLMTRTQNEFKDPVFEFTYPAHWAYDGMGQAYGNKGAFISNVSVTNGIPNILNPEQVFQEGDDIIYRTLLPAAVGRWNPQNKLNAYRVGNSVLKLYKADGTVFSTLAGTTCDLKITRSGRRNIASAPVGTVTLKSAPVPGSNIHTLLNNPNTPIVDAFALTFNDLWQREFSCTDDPVGTNTIVNPYRRGMKGSWRTSQAFVNFRQRSGSTIAANTDIRTQGLNENFQPFWSFSNGKITPNAPSANWVMKSRATKYDFKGNQVEEVDALGIHSSALFGYKNSVATAVAHNSQYNQIMNENFEDIDYKLSNPCDSSGVFCIYKSHGEIGEIISSTPFTAHTGIRSLELAAASSTELSVDIDATSGRFPLVEDGDVYKYGTGAGLPIFSPDTGWYVVSAWVKVVPPGTNTCFNYNSLPANLPRITILLDNQVQNTFIANEGPVIDGWRRIFGLFYIGTTHDLLKIKLSAFTSEGPNKTYFDDLRIHPYLGNMKSFVYHPYTMRLMATLDENNYATFYEYDEEGMLVRTKRETERGIMTVQENRSVLRPNNTD